MSSLDISHNVKLNGYEANEEEKKTNRIIYFRSMICFLSSLGPKRFQEILHETTGLLEHHHREEKRAAFFSLFFHKIQEENTSHFLQIKYKKEALIIQKINYTRIKANRFCFSSVVDCVKRRRERWCEERTGLM